MQRRTLQSKRTESIVRNLLGRGQIIERPRKFLVLLSSDCKPQICRLYSCLLGCARRETCTSKERVKDGAITYLWFLRWSVDVCRCGNADHHLRDSPWPGTSFPCPKRRSTCWRGRHFWVGRGSGAHWWLTSHCAWWWCEPSTSPSWRSTAWLSCVRLATPFQIHLCQCKNGRWNWLSTPLIRKNMKMSLTHQVQIETLKSRNPMSNIME